MSKTFTQFELSETKSWWYGKNVSFFVESGVVKMLYNEHTEQEHVLSAVSLPYNYGLYYFQSLNSPFLKPEEVTKNIPKLLEKIQRDMSK